MVEAPAAVEPLGGGGSSASLEAVPAGDSDALLLLATDSGALRQAAVAYLDGLVARVGGQGGVAEAFCILGFWDVTGASFDGRWGNRTMLQFPQGSPAPSLSHCLSICAPQFDESVDRMFAALRAGEGGAPRSSAGGSTPGAATPGGTLAGGGAPAVDAAALVAAVAAAHGPQAAAAVAEAAAQAAAAGAGQPGQAAAAAAVAGTEGEEGDHSDEEMEGSAALMSEDEAVLLGPGDAEVAAAAAAGTMSAGSGGGAVKGSPEYQAGGCWLWDVGWDGWE